MYIKIILGFCLFFAGIKLLSGGLKEAANFEWLMVIDNHILMFLVSILFTAIFQSSSFTSAILLLLVSSGKITLSTAIGGIIGANVGTTSTVWLSGIFGGMDKEGMKVAVIHSGFNLFMALIFLPFCSKLSEWME